MEGQPTPATILPAGQRGSGLPASPRPALPPPPTPKLKQPPNPGVAGNAYGTQVDLANRKACTQLPASVLRSPPQLAACQKLQQKLATLEIAAIVTLSRFNPSQACWEWELPAEFIPMSARKGRMSNDDVTVITLKLLESLKALHAVGLSVIDFSPDQVLIHTARPELILIPSPWFCCDEFRGMSSTIARVIAPEVAAGLPAGGEIRADLYGLGKLVFRLLTERASAVHELEFPSDVDPHFELWDGFVDGCCRSSLERRFTSLAEASQFLPGQQRQRTVPASADASQPSKNQVSVIAAVVLFIALLGGLWGLSRVGVLPSLDRLGWPAVPERGFADTVLKYRSPLYEGTKWKELSEIRALREMTNERLKFSHITGWDKENLSVAAYEWGKLVVFRYHNAHWAVFTRMEMQSNQLEQKFLSQDTLLLAGYTGSGSKADRQSGVYKISSVGTAKYGDIPGRRGDVTLTPMAADLCFVFDPSGGAKGSIRIIDTVSEEIDVTLHKDAFVHQADNVPLKEFPIQNIIKTRSDRSGHAIGFCYPNARGKHHLLVEFRDGIWYRLAELLSSNRPDREVLPRDLWYSTSSNESFVVWVAESGNVFRYQFGKSVVEQQLPPTTELTSTKLIRVWGANLSDYHVMDTNGTIWHWDGIQWQIAIRGLREKNVEFIGAWVSPEGTVYGITELEVYQLR